MLDITRLKAGRMKLNYNTIDVVELTKEITESVRAFAHRKGIRIHYKTDIDELWISIDDEKYERILLNLLSNAIKFTPANKNVSVKLTMEGFFLRLEVKDQGIGIDPDKQAIIFDRFEQVDNTLSRQAEGTGIGLYLVKSFTEALGGTISLASKANKGSVFTILIPLQEETVKKQNSKKNNIDRYVSRELSDIL
jgi:signal transduction histidine kinase